MSIVNACVERKSHVRPLRGPRGPQVLTFIFTFFQPVIIGLADTLNESPMKSATRNHPYIRRHTASTSAPVPLPSPTPPLSQQIENVFIHALVHACHCRQNEPKLNLLEASSGNMHHKARRRHLCNGGRQIRSFHRSCNAHRPILQTSLSRDEYLNMVDYHEKDSDAQATWQSPLSTSPLPPPSSPFSQKEENVPKEVLQPSLDAQVESVKPSVHPLHPDEALAIAKLASVLADPNCTHDQAWTAYSALPFLHIACVPKAIRHQLLKRLSTIERKGKQSMFRYLSVVEDMKRLGIPMTGGEWNSAIAYSAHCFDRVGAAGVESALHMWKEMEHKAKVKSGKVTFNILFDVAAKAGKFVLAEMILKEMESRGLGINRYARVKLIYYHGLKGDGDSVRRAYRDFVEAGEIVDTVVMNCVIASLIRAGEFPAAEQVYERMKRILRQNTGRQIPYLDWQEPRSLGRILDRATRRYAANSTELQQIRDKQFLAPSHHTFTIFVEYHVTHTGELRRIAALLADMQEMGISMDGRIFVKILKGFSNHGGVRFTTWTKARLESVMESLLNALDQGLNEGRPGKWTIIWAVRAFDRCCSHERTLQIWEELCSRWKPGEGELDLVQSMLRNILSDAIGEVEKSPSGQEKICA